MASRGHECVCAGFLMCLIVHTVGANICCSYQQFEADTFADEAYVFIDSGRLGTDYSYDNVTSHLAYDYINNRTYANITNVEVSPLLPQPVTIHYELINDYKKGTQYMFNDNVCLKSPLGAFEPYCVPDDAVMLSRGYIGNNQSYLTTYLVTHLPDLTVYRESIDPTNCLPAFITYTVDSSLPDSGTMNSLIVTNVRPGISNPAVFTPPQSCLTISNSKLDQMPRSLRHKLARLPPFIKI